MLAAIHLQLPSSKSGLSALSRRGYAKSAQKGSKSSTKTAKKKVNRKNGSTVMLGGQKVTLNAPLADEPLWLRQRRQADELAAYTNKLAKALQRLQTQENIPTSSHSSKAKTPRRRIRRSISYPAKVKPIAALEPQFTIDMDPEMKQHIIDTPPEAKELKPRKKKSANLHPPPTTSMSTSLASSTPTSNSPPPQKSSVATSITPKVSRQEEKQLDTLQMRRLKSALGEVETISSQRQTERKVVEAAADDAATSRKPESVKSVKKRRRVALRRYAAKPPSELQLKAEKAYRKLWREAKGEKVPSMKQLRKEWRQLQPDLKRAKKIAKFTKLGYMILPRRPPPQRQQRALEWAEEQRLTRDTLIAEPGKLPSSLFTGRVFSSANSKDVDVAAQPFLTRTTHWWVLATLAAAALAYELTLAVNEWYYTNRPQTLARHVDLEFQTKAQLLLEIMRRRREDEILDQQDSRKWMQIEFGYLPRFIWRWLLRAELERIDPTVYLLVHTWQNLRDWLVSTNVSFFMHHSRFWKQHARQINAGSKVLASLKSNEILPPRVARLHRHVIQQAVDDDDTAIYMLQQDAIPALLTSVANARLDESETDFLLESLILRTILGNTARIKAFWSLSEETIAATLDALLLHTETQPTMVGFVVAALTSVQLPPALSEHNTRVLASAITMLRDHEMRFAYAANFGYIATNNLTAVATKSISPPPSYNFEPERLLTDPSVGYVITSSTMTAGYLFLRINSNSFWKGLGMLPHRLRLVQVQKRLLPALIASAVWAFTNTTAPTLHEIAGRYAGLEATDPKKGRLILRSQNSPLRPALLSLSYGVCEWGLKLSMLWKVPFILAPQIISEYLKTPFVWYRRWKHSRIQSRPRKKLQ